ncbi:MULTISPECIES: hypothetical protein [unclassified Streptomyces]|uniref:hypothetical protein n=1 Tax=unclassified Streptomyces TaxID=2593676 RepID=UPI00379B25C3
MTTTRSLRFFREKGPLLLDRADLAAFARHLADGDSRQAGMLLKPDPERWDEAG